LEGDGGERYEHNNSIEYFTVFLKNLVEIIEKNQDSVPLIEIFKLSSMTIIKI